MKTTYYRTDYSYNAGLLGTEHFSTTEEEAKAFEKEYIKNFNDCNKGFTTYKLTRIKVFGITVKTEAEKVHSWYEE